MLTNKKIMMVSTTDNMIWQFLMPHIKHLESLGNTVECFCAKTGFWFDELKEKHNLIMDEMDFGRNPLKIKKRIVNNTQIAVCNLKVTMNENRHIRILFITSIIAM